MVRLLQFAKNNSQNIERTSLMGRHCQVAGDTGI